MLIILGAADYANSLNNVFHYDDIHSIIENDSTRTTIPKNVWISNSRARFLSMYSFSLNYSLHGFDRLWGWHIVNIAAHVACALLVYELLILGRGGNGPRALLAAAIFLVHPLCAEPVNYIQARSIQFALLFALAAAFFLILFLRAHSRLALGACAISVLAGCMSKEVGAYYTIAIPLLFWLRENPAPFRPLRHLRAKWFLASGAALLLIAGAFAYTTGIAANIADRLAMVSYPAYVLKEAAAFFIYLKLLLLPIGLSADHSLLLPSRVSWELTLAGAAFFALIPLAVRLWRGIRPLGFLLAWLLIMHLPYLLVPGPELVVEYRAYPMVVGFAGAAAWTLLRPLSWPRLRAALIVSVILLLALISFNRNEAWKNGVSLWSDCVAADANNPRACNNLGSAYIQHANYDLARQALTRAALLAPGAAEVNYNLGFLCAREKNYPEAICSLKLAIARNPELTRAYNALGMAYALNKQCDDAIASYLAAIERNPYFIEARNGLGNAYSAKGRYVEAIREYRTVVDWGVKSPEVYRNLGDAYRGNNELDAAVACYRKSLELNGNSPSAHNNLGNALKDLGLLEQAVESYRRAIELDPTYAIAHNNLGGVYIMLKSYDRASLALEQAIALDPNLASAQGNLGSLEHMRGDYAAAAEHYRKAIELAPDYADAHYNLAVALRKMDRKNESLAAYLEAARLRPNWAPVHASLGALYLELNDRENAGKSLCQALALSPELAQRHDVAQALAALGMTVGR